MLHQEKGSGYEQLIRVIRQVRRRWRFSVAMRGVAFLFVLGFLAFAVSAFGMDYFRYSDGAVTAFRVFAYLAMLALTVRFLVLLPAFRRVSDEQVALYIEEHDPSLQQAVISAVEAGSETDQKVRPEISPSLIQKLVESAVEQCGSMDYGRGIERGRLARASGTLTLLAVAGMLAVVIGPSFLRYGGSLLIKPWRNAQAASPYFITVEPGNIRVARGADQMIEAGLGGFDSDRVEVSVKSGDSDDEWQRWPMAFDEEAGAYAFMLFDLQDTAHYYVEAGGVRSDLFRIDVVDLPFVERIDLEYNFPEYTGLESRLVEDGGDIAALRGTRVRLTVTPTVKVAGGRIDLEGAEAIPLQLEEDSTLTAGLVVEEEGFYKVELEGFDGRMYKASADYTIEVLTDQPPSVTITKPGRDTKVTSIEEVFTEIEAEDDYGVAKLELVYSVNGGEEEAVGLLDDDGAKKEFSAGHTFFLEDFELVPGDFISYFARAADSGHIAGEQTATTDIYFIEVRPFGKDYRQAQQGMGGGGGGGGADGTLSLRQRQIVAATFRLIRDKSEYSPQDYAENLTTIALMQGRLREQVENLLRRMTNRGITGQETDFGKISGSLRLAAQEMAPAEEMLMEKKPKDALPPEQRALQHLQRAEAVFRDVQVSFGGGGGGGGGEQANAEELADLFELELDKLRNQYETVERGERQSTDNQIDEALQRLQELARRQQQENERMKRRGSSLPNQGGRGSASQRDLADEAEELARRLEKLAREHSQPDLMDTARRLKEAADSMRRGAASGKQGSLSEGIAALDELKEARRLLEKSRSTRLEEDIEEIQSRAERLASQQDKVMSDVRKMVEQGGGDSERLERVLERKDEMASEVADLEAQMDRMARESRAEQKDASRKLQEAANAIRESKLKEKIRYSKGVVQGRSPEYAERFEEQVQKDIENLKEKIGQAAGSVGESEEAQVADAIEKTRDLVRNLESLGERIRERQEQARRLGRGREQGGEEPSESGRQGERSESEQPSEQQGSSGEQGQSGEEAGAEPFGPGVSGAGSQDGRSFQPGTFSTEDLRQWRREFRERMKEADDLRRELQRQDLQVPDLQSIIERMKAFDQNQVYLDPLGFDELQGALLEELKQFEYWLRRELEGIGDDKLFLAGSDQVPPEYRKLVEEYYRSLSRQPPKKQR